MAVPLVNIGGRWDYTDAEWEEICAAVKRVRPDPLSDTERKALRLTADDYIAGVRNYPKRKTQANEQRAWKKASGLISDLQQAIKLAAGLADKNRKLFILTEDMLAAVLGKSQPSPGITKLVLSDVHVMTIGELGVLLSQLKFQIDLQVEICRSRGPAKYKWETYSGRLEPRVSYMQQILWLWTHRFGGKLTLSVDSTHIPARIYGPLVDYVSAVAGPVMKNDAPKPSHRFSPVLHFDAAEWAPSTASKADIALGTHHVRFTPESGHRRLIHHFVDTPEQWYRDGEAERLGGSHIEDQIHLD